MGWLRGYSFICVRIGKEEDAPTSTALSQPSVQEFWASVQEFWAAV